MIYLLPTEDCAFPHQTNNNFCPNSSGKIPKNACFMEVIIPIKRRKENYDKKHFVQLPDLLGVSFCYPKEGGC